MSVAGALIQVARLKSGLTQRQVAASAGTSASAIAAYELGHRDPSLPTLLRILRGAGFDLRMHLAPRDDHDEALTQWLASLPAGQRRTLPGTRKRTSRRLREPVE